MSDPKAEEQLNEDPPPTSPDEAWVEVDDDELGEALGEALAEAATEVDESETEAEAPGSEEEPAPRKTRKGKKKKDKVRKAGIDGTLAFVLLVNLAFMAAIVLLPEPAREPGEPEPETPIGKEPAGDDTGIEPGPSGAEPVRPKPFESRIAQMAEVESLVAKGDFAGAIGLLEDSLRKHPDLPDSVRRALYSRLSHYAGEAGDHESALRYLRLSNSGFQMSLLPGDLWKMAQDAKQLGDFQGSRKLLARYLLQESLMSDEQKARISTAFLELADGYRNEADAAVRKHGEGGR